MIARTQYIVAGALAAALTGLAACGGGASYAPPVQAPTQPPANPTPIASVSPSPTASPTPAPTFTPLPSPTPTTTASPTPAPSYLADTIWPKPECVSTKSGNSYMMFGYDSKRGESITLAAGTAANQVLIITSSGTSLANPQPQPATFDPGLHDNAFQVNLPKGEVSVEWDIDGNVLGPISKESGLPACSTGGNG